MRVLLLTVTMIAALTCIGAASDGVIEINQARALAGEVTPGDAAGFPVTISHSGSYRLTSNLTVTSGGNDGIDIEASQVTIDLNGFAIVESGPPEAAGIEVMGNMDDAAIVNGAVSGFVVGVVEFGSGGRIERLRVNAATPVMTSGIVVLGNRALVSGCTVRHAAVGIQVAQSGLVTGNIVSDSSTGLLLGPAVGYSGNALLGNTQHNVTGGVSLGANLCDHKLCP